MIKHLQPRLCPEALLLFWVGFIWRKWNVIVIGSLGWLCLFNSLGCCNVQEAVGWRVAGYAEAPKFHTPPWGWTRDGGWQVQRTCLKSSIRELPRSWSPSLQGRTLRRVLSIIVKNSGDTLFMRKIRQGNYRKEQEATAVFQSEFQYLTITS